MSQCTDTHTCSCVSGREEIGWCVLARMYLQTCGPEQVQLTHANRQTHICRLKLCWWARHGVTRWRGTAGCRWCRPGVRGGQARKLHPPERHRSTKGEDGWLDSFFFFFWPALLPFLVCLYAGISSCIYMYVYIYQGCVFPLGSRNEFPEQDGKLRSRHSRPPSPPR